MGTWRILHPQRIFHATCAISVHGSVWQASLEPRPSSPELSALSIEQPRTCNIIRKNLEGKGEVRMQQLAEESEMTTNKQK